MNIIIFEINANPVSYTQYVYEKLLVPCPTLSNNYEKNTSNMFIIFFLSVSPRGQLSAAAAAFLVSAVTSLLGRILLKLQSMNTLFEKQLTCPLRRAGVGKETWEILSYNFLVLPIHIIPTSSAGCRVF